MITVDVMLNGNILSTHVLSTNDNTVTRQYTKLILSRHTLAWANLPHVPANPWYIGGRVPTQVYIWWGEGQININDNGYINNVRSKQ